MSAFAVIYDANPLENPGALHRIMERLNHRGPDGSSFVFAKNVAMGHWRFWTTPEEVGERQPLELRGLPFKIVLDGRIDNREELFAKLNLSPAEGKTLSDAALILRAYDRWREECFQYFVGEFALAIFDEQRGELVCVRDQLGDRTLFYANGNAQTIVASEPWAIAAVNDAKPDLNESAVAHYFALKAPENGQTLFNNIYELLPAHVMVVSKTARRIRRYWQPDPQKKIRYKTDEEYAAHFLALLEESVRCRMRSNAPIGILMSGGLDSTSVASIAARKIKPEALTAISYVFDELTDCDERQYINAVKAQWNTRSIQIPCDDAYPYKDWANWRRNPNHPEGNPYRLLKERAYQRANNEGVRVLLTGGFGDHLYDGAEDWMADLIEDGRLMQAAQGFAYHVRAFGLRRSLAAKSTRRAARRALDQLPGGKRLRGKATAAPWLTPFSIRSMDNQSGAWLDPAFATKENLLGLIAAQNGTGDTFGASRHAIELRHPYRDRRLVEFALALPAYQFYYRGVHKYILRVAMQGILPEIIRARSQPSSLISLFFRGVEREKNLLEGYFQNPNANWRKFVKADWLSSRWNIPVTPEKDGPEALISWLCASYEAW
ncbi:MAG: asparagine synthase-related protein [Anaerolineales bacterium]|nr:asparagine synthase-related protein [Anaerolineales bacterium]